MIEHRDLQRVIGAYLEAGATTSAPDGLREAALARVATTRQRPRWLVRETWIPSGLSTRVSPLPRGATVAMVFILVALAVAVALVIVVGSQRRLPAPFGPARAGLIVFDLSGDLYVANADGTGRSQITSGPDVDYRQVWSPDGTLITYLSQVADLSFDLRVVDAHGQHQLTLADHIAEAGDLVWSPDSRQVAYDARIVGQHSYQVFVASLDRPSPTQLGGPDVYGEDPSWSPDGREIAFKRVAPCCEPAIDQLWLMSAAGTNVHLLSPTRGNGNALWNTAWSPDGKRLAFLAPGGVGEHFDVYVINEDGTGQRNISNSPEDEMWPTWSPDGTQIAFARMSPVANNAGTLVVVDPDGSHLHLLKGPPINSNAPIWSPDGTKVLAYAKDPDPLFDENGAIAVFDPTGRAETTTIPAPLFTSASWQRLAP